jgi:hypothetical protein
MSRLKLRLFSPVKTAIPKYPDSFQYHPVFGFMVAEYMVAVMADIDEHLRSGLFRFGQPIVSHGFKAVGEKSFGTAAAADRLIAVTRHFNQINAGKFLQHLPRAGQIQALWTAFSHTLEALHTGKSAIKNRPAGFSGF